MGKRSPEAQARHDRLKRLTEFTMGWAQVLTKLKTALQAAEGVELSADEVKVLLDGIRAVAGPARGRLPHELEH